MLDNIEIIDIDSELYSKNLRNIDNPPERLYCCGDTSLLNNKSVAVVGSRKYTVYGKSVAELVGRSLAEAGIVVVSGLAFGIDAFAHSAMVEAGGKGIAVLGSGILKMTPQKNYRLMEKIVAKGGLIISEYPPYMDAAKWTYPERNRIISGLSEALVVIEANFNSGSLITAQHANEQGRTIYAVPGNINSQFSLGSNLLIRNGAIPLVVIDDLIKEIGEASRLENPKIELGEDELRIYNIVKKYNGISVNTISEELKMRVSSVNSILTVMEIKGLVVSYSGKIHLAKYFS